MRTIRIYGDPVLRSEARRIDVFDDALREFAREMVEAMRQADGVGLAAPQVGESIRLTVIDPTGGEGEPVVFINPILVSSSDEKTDAEEGCLSVPGIHLPVTRSIMVSVEAFDPRGNPFSVENVQGLYARALQHEIDHLNGILFVDRISPVRRQLISGKLKKMARSNRDRKNAP